MKKLCGLMIVLVIVAIALMLVGCAGPGGLRLMPLGSVTYTTTVNYYPGMGQYKPGEWQKLPTQVLEGLAKQEMGTTNIIVTTNESGATQSKAAATNIQTPFQGGVATQGPQGAQVPAESSTATTEGSPSGGGTATPPAVP